MSRALSILVSLMLLLTLGLAQAPRLCVGDGHGGACRMEACACVADCSCQAAHRHALAEEQVPECCRVDSHQAAGSACHGPKQWPNFAPPERHWFALVPVAVAPMRLDRPDARVIGGPARAIAALLAPPEKPPRIAA